MRGIRVQLPEQLESRFREAAMKRFGFGKGALSRAAAEAIQNWLRTTGETVRYTGDPVRAIDGILSNLKIDSVGLQHMVKKLWAAKASHHVSR